MGESRPAVRNHRFAALAMPFLVAFVSACGGSDASAGTRLWYVGGAICAFSAAQLTTGQSGRPAIKVNVTGAQRPGDLAIDARGDVWVADPDGNQILRLPASAVGASRDAAPDVILQSASLDDPRSLVFDAHGDLWVANRGSGAGPSNGSIVRFSQPGRLSGTQTVDASLRIETATADDFFLLGAIGFDPQGNLWATSYTGLLRFDGVRELSGEQTVSPSAAIATSGYLPRSFFFYGMAFDAEGSLWASAQTDGFDLTSVLKFTDPGKLAGTSSPVPAVTIAGEPDLLPAGGLAFDEEGSLWLATADALKKYGQPLALAGEVNPAPAVVLPVVNDASPALNAHLVFFPAH